MARFNTKGVKAPNSSAIQTTDELTFNYEGATVYSRDAKSELFLLAVSNFVGSDTPYEKGSDRDERYRDLVRKLAIEDFTWVREMLKWLRHGGNLRTAPLIGATEAIQVRTQHGLSENNGNLVEDVLIRPDEAGEYLAYRVGKYGKNLSKGEKWGLEKVIQRVYTQRNYLKWDSSKSGYRFADVVELIHAKPSDERQSELFKYMLDERHHKDGQVGDLKMLEEKARWEEMAKSPSVYKNALTEPDFLIRAGLTWEDVLSRLGSEIPKKDLWEALIPGMGHMALLRNLRNFDMAGVSDKAANIVLASLMSEEAVAKGRQLPFRYYTAYKNVTSLRWGYPLEIALGYSLSHVPSLKGSTLVLVDVSPSMYPESGGMYSGRNDKSSEIALAEKAALFGTALAVRGEDVDLVQFGGESSRINVPKGASVLKVMQQFKMTNYTDIPAAVKKNFKPGQHKRVIIITDEQTRPGWLPSNMSWNGSRETKIDDLIPTSVPVHMWNLAGYSGSLLNNGTNRYTMGGLTDHSFKQIELLEKGAKGTWPWE